MDGMDEDEKKRMLALIKDRELGDNMDWMYRSGKTDSEEYLLGKSIEKMVVEEGTGSIISERIRAHVAMDMQAKMRDDPLFAIRRKEEDARRRLLENPVKVRQLERLLEQQRQLALTSASKAKKNKKHRKKKRKKCNHGSSSSDSSDIGDSLLNQYLEILTHKKRTTCEGVQQVPCVPCKRSRHDPSNEKVKSIGQSFQTRCSRIKGNNPNNYSCNDVTFRHDLSSDNIDNVKLNVPTSVSERRGMCVGDGNAEQVDHPYGLLEVHGNKTYSPLSHQKSRQHSFIARHHESSSPQTSTCSLTSHHRERRHHSPSHESARILHYMKGRTPSSSSDHRTSHKRYAETCSEKKSQSPKECERSSEKHYHKKLTEEEKAARVREMMKDAHLLSDQRKQNVHRYRVEDKMTDAKKCRADRLQGVEALSSMMSDFASQSSVEDRLKRNKHNIQRTTAALDKNFTQR